MTDDETVISPSEGDEQPPVYVQVPDEQAEELIATRQAVPADGVTAMHELVPEDTNDVSIDRDEIDWALDEATSMAEDEKETDKQSPSAVSKTRTLF